MAHDPRPAADLHPPSLGEGGGGGRRGLLLSRVAPSPADPHPGLPPEGEGASPGPNFCHFAQDCLPGAPRVLAIATHLPHAGSPEHARQHARALARAALRRALADAWGCAPAALAISDQRGQPPGLGWAGTGAAPAALATTSLSISHAPGLSLAAWCLQGCVGVDLQAMPQQSSRAELLHTAGQFLPPDSIETLAKQAQDAPFIEAFTDRWAAHEAALKCLGQALTEYHPALATRLAGVRPASLRLPGWAAPDLVAALAWRPAQP